MIYFISKENDMRYLPYIIILSFSIIGALYTVLYINLKKKKEKDFITYEENANKETEEKNKIFKMTDFCQRFSYRDSVPDPYYGGDSGFELVLDLLEDAVEGLLDQLGNK